MRTSVGDLGQAKDEKSWKDDEKNEWKAGWVEVSLNVLHFIKVTVGGT